MKHLKIYEQDGIYGSTTKSFISQSSLILSKLEDGFAIKIKSVEEVQDFLDMINNFGQGIDTTKINMHNEYLYFILIGKHLYSLIDSKIGDQYLEIYITE